MREHERVRRETEKPYTKDEHMLLFSTPPNGLDGH